MSLSLFDESEAQLRVMPSPCKEEAEYTEEESFHSSLQHLEDSLQLAGLHSESFPALLGGAHASGSITQRQCVELVEGMRNMWMERNLVQSQVQQVSLTERHSRRAGPPDAISHPSRCASLLSCFTSPRPSWIACALTTRTCCSACPT